MGNGKAAEEAAARAIGKFCRALRKRWDGDGEMKSGVEMETATIQTGSARSDETELDSKAGKLIENLCLHEALRVFCMSFHLHREYSTVRVSVLYCMVCTYF